MIDPAPGLGPLFVGDSGDLGAVVEPADRAAAREFLEQSGVAFALRVGHGAAEGRHVEATGIAETAGGGAQPVDLDQDQARSVEMARGQQEVRRARVAADHRVQDEVVLRAVADPGPVFGLQFDALETSPRDEVGDPGDGFRPVDGRGAVLEDFDPFDGQHRHEGREVHETGTVVRLHRGQHLPPSVEQHQGRRDAKPAQVDVGGTDREVLGQVVGVVLSAGVDRQNPDQVTDVLEPGIEQIVAFVARQRGWRVDLAGDAAAGLRRRDHDFLDGW